MVSVALLTHIPATKKIITILTTKGDLLARLEVDSNITFADVLQWYRDAYKLPTDASVQFCSAQDPLLSFTFHPVSKVMCASLQNDTVYVDVQKPAT